MNITHSQIVEIGYNWAMKRCGFAFKEFKTLYTDEIPDIIGFNHSGTFLIEAKVSRADFLKDSKKVFRQNPMLGMGDWRFFIAPVGLINVDELPELWGLIEVDEKLKCKTVHNPFGKGNFYHNWKRHEKCSRSEQKVLYSALRRLEVNGGFDKIFVK